jgi:hypothetical protein
MTLKDTYQSVTRRFYKSSTHRKPSFTKDSFTKTQLSTLAAQSAVARQKFKNAPLTELNEN